MYNSIPSIMMSEKEEAVYREYISKAKNYLEFGIGGSTLVALSHSNIAQVYGVDSDVKYLQYIQTIAENDSRLILKYADIGKTGFLGYPLDDKKREQFSAYSSNVFEIIEKKIDLVLIDGRFRVACTLQTILKNLDNNDIIIMIHDFGYREEYQIVRKFLNMIGLKEGLGIFTMKKEINISELSCLYDIYKYIAF